VSISIAECPIESVAEQKALKKAKKRLLKDAAAKRKSSDANTLTLDEYRREVELEEEIKRRRAEIATQDPDEAEPVEPASESSVGNGYVLLDEDPFTVFDLKLSNE